MVFKVFLLYTPGFIASNENPKNPLHVWNIFTKNIPTTIYHGIETVKNVWKSEENIKAFILS